MKTGVLKYFVFLTTLGMTTLLPSDLPAQMSPLPGQKPIKTRVKTFDRIELLKTATVSMLEPLVPDQKIYGLQNWGEGFGNSADSFLAGDLNKDGLDDLVLYTKLTGEWRVYESQGNRFGSGGLLAQNFGAQSEWVATGDFNGDGYADGLQKTGDVWEVALNSKNGSFEAPAIWDTGFGDAATAQFVGDFDGDGLDDIMIFESPTSTWHVKLSNGGTFVDQGVWETGFGGSSDKQFVGDVDGDGDDDLVVLYEGSGDWHVAENTGGNFSDRGRWIKNFGANGVEHFVADFDGDGKEDIAHYTGVIEVARAIDNAFEDLGLWHPDFGAANDYVVPLVAKMDNDQRADFLRFHSNLEVWHVGLTLPHLSMPIGLARNDSESFYLVLYNETEPQVDNIKLSVKGMPSGVEVGFHHVGYIDRALKDPNNLSVADPLVPNKYKGPFDLERYKQEVVLVTIETSLDVAASLYSGYLTMESTLKDSEATAIQKVDLNVRVWDFQLPVRPTLATDYRQWRQDAKDVYDDDDRAAAVFLVWAEEFRKRRITIGFNAQRYYIDETDNLSNQPINDILDLQDDETTYTNVTLGYPGMLECDWGHFYNDSVCDGDQCVGSCLPAPIMMENLLGHDEFRQLSDTIVSFVAGKQSSLVPVLPANRRHFIFADEGLEKPASNQVTGKAISRLNSGRSEFGASSRYQRVGDFNGDGFDDLLAYFHFGPSEVALNDGSGSFSKQQLWDSSIGDSATSFHVGDFDGDGLDDIMLFHDPPATWNVKLSNGAAFADQGIWETGFGSGSDKQFVGDVDGDGDDDLIVLYEASGDWYVAENTGGNFSDRGLWRGNHGAGASAHFVGDFDGDDKTDVATVLPNGEWHVATSKGDKFSSPILVFADFTISPLATVLAADIDNNGLDDFVLGSTEDGEWWTALINGPDLDATNFCRATAEPFGYAKNTLLVGDFADLTPGQNEGDDVLAFNSHKMGIIDGSWTVAVADGSGKFVVPRDRNLFAGMRTIAPYPSVRELYEGVDTWVPSLPEFVGTTIDEIREVQSFGDGVWAWTHAPSADLSSVIRPGLVPGRHPLETYVYPWYNWRHQIDGTHFWRVGLWREHPSCEPNICPVHFQTLPSFVDNNYSDWQCFRNDTSTGCVPGEQANGTTNGNGLLTYPGWDPVFEKPYMVSTVRLEVLRGGIEDYDYFALLQYAADVLGDSKAQAFLNEVEKGEKYIGRINNTEEWWDVGAMAEKRIENFRAFRKDIGSHLETISFPDEVKASLPGNFPPRRQQVCVANTL